MEMNDCNYDLKLANRVEWIDALKGFGIFCVTLGHLGCWYPLEKHIYSFHMFLFFFLSGYLHSRKYSKKEYILRKWKALMIPFLTWNVCSSLVALLKGDDIAQVILDFFVIDGQLVWNAPIWFLLVLFMTEVLYVILPSEMQNQKVIIMSMAVLLWWLCGEYQMHLKMNLIPLALLFYAFGDLCKNIKIENILTNPRKRTGILILSGGAVRYLVQL